MTISAARNRRRPTHTVRCDTTTSSSDLRCDENVGGTSLSDRTEDVPLRERPLATPVRRDYPKTVVVMVSFRPCTRQRGFDSADPFALVTRGLRESARATSRRARSRGTRSEEGGRPRERSPRLRTRPGGWGRPALTRRVPRDRSVESRDHSNSVASALAHWPTGTIAFGCVADIVEFRRWRCLSTCVWPLTATRS
jgi:hypothetical protein